MPNRFACGVETLSLNNARAELVKTGLQLSKKGSLELETFLLDYVQKGKTAKKAELKKERRETHKDLFKINPLAALHSEYLIHDNLLSVRNRSKWGEWDSFFLLAVSEHFRKTIARPHFDWASQLLKTINPQFTAKTTNAKSKVFQLKQSHPSWKSHLKFVNKVCALPPFSIPKGK